MTSTVIDRKNAEFWNELCGTAFARSLGITDLSPDSLRRFDDEYLRFYPYLGRYVSGEKAQDTQVLEIGLGYGTLGQLLALQGCRYHGLDIALNPVALMRYRLSLLGLDGGSLVQVGSALDIPYKDGAFDYVYSIGCLHHTGDLARSIAEVNRVLKDRGTAVIMLYHRDSFRRLVHLPALRFRNLLRGAWEPFRGPSEWKRWVRGSYDKNTHGVEAPHTDFVSRAEVRKLFGAFRSVRIESQNCDPLILPGGRIVISRENMLGTLGRMAGLDLYITACK